MPGAENPHGGMPMTGATPGGGNPHEGMGMPCGAAGGKMPSPEDLPPAGKKKE